METHIRNAVLRAVHETTSSSLRGRPRKLSIAETLQNIFCLDGEIVRRHSDSIFFETVGGIIPSALDSDFFSDCRWDLSWRRDFPSALRRLSGSVRADAYDRFPRRSQGTFIRFQPQHLHRILYQRWVCSHELLVPCFHFYHVSWEQSGCVILPISTTLPYRASEKS